MLTVPDRSAAETSAELTYFPAEVLLEFVATVLVAAGAREADASAVAQHLVEANLQGHDSHGVGMLPAYVRHVRAGLVNLASTPRLIQESGVVIKVDADSGWGALAGRFAIESGIPVARAQGAAVVTLANAHHLGRIGAFAEQALAAGLISLHFVNVMDHAPLVAPFGGKEARLGTNPVCIGFPARDDQAPVLLDMATSRIALGKARVAAARGERVPFGSILDAAGRPTDDPSGISGFEVQGALASMGEHKGYGLALMCELLAGALSGAGTIQPGSPRRGGIKNSMLSILLDPERFGDPDWLREEASRMCAYACSAPRMEAHEAVLVPGDPERIRRRDRDRTGIALDQQTLLQLEEVAVSAGLPGPGELRYASRQSRPAPNTIPSSPSTTEQS